MNGSNAQLLLNEFCYVCHGEASSCCEGRIGGTHFVSVCARNGIAMVPVGDDHGCTGNCRTNGLNALCVGDPFNTMHHAVFVGHFTHEFSGSKKHFSQTTAERQAPDRRQVALRGPCEVKPVCLGLRRCLLMRKNATRTNINNFKCANDPNGMAIFPR